MKREFSAAPRWQKLRQPSYCRARKQNIPPTVVWHAEELPKEQFTMENKITSNPDSAVCCFCGKSVKLINAIVLQLKPNPNSDEIQTLFSHKSCLGKLIDPSIPMHPDIRD